MMNKIMKAVTYSYNRNIGWQDGTLRTIFGILSLIGAIYFYAVNITVSLTLAALFIAQVVTVFSSRCPICYFTGVCTITASERQSLTAKGLKYEK